MTDTDENINSMTLGGVVLKKPAIDWFISELTSSYSTKILLDSILNSTALIVSD